MIERPGFMRARKRFLVFSLVLLEGILIAASTCSAQLTGALAPLATFGGGDGWLAPFEYEDYPYLGVSNLERGMAYGNGHLYLVSRNPTPGIRILDAATGVDPGTELDLGSLNLGTGIISGGTFALNMVAVGGDGAIYVGNLQGTTSTAGGAFYKVYKWANESATPTVAYSGNAGLDGARIGDDIAVIGSGASTRIVAGFGNNTSVTGNNGYAVIDPTAGTATAVSFPSTPPNAGDFQLGITFTDANHVIGTRGGGTYDYTSYSGSAGTLIATPTLAHPGGATAERQMAYDVINGTPLLAIQSTGDAHVSIYSLADPSNPVYLTDGNATNGTLATNGNSTGSVAWGPTVNNGDGTFSASLYAMSTNAGIQAFTFTLSPSTVVSVPGDYNHNGVVDAADYVLWRDTLNQSVPAGTGADGDGDGVVTQADYNFWRARFGNTSGSGSLASANVPEPASLVACCVACGMITLASRRRALK